MHIRRMFFCALVVGVVAGCATAPTTTMRNADDDPVPPRDTHERLNGLLWMQTSAEFKLLSTIAYRDARVALERIAIDAKRGVAVPSAAEEQTGLYDPQKPLAIVIDIDETVLDNSPMSGRLIKTRSPYSTENWSGWVERKSADYLPGAKEFIDAARSLGYAVFFVTNRTEAEEAATLENLSTVGATEREVLASEEVGDGESVAWTSEKKARREYIARSHWIAVMVGDDLGDFIAGIRKLPPAERVIEAQKRANRFGSQWFLLPNPIYGSWESVLYNRDDPDAKQLADKIGKVVGY